MKRIFTFVVALTMAVTLVACGGGSSSSSASDTIVYGCTELDGVFSPLYYSSTYDGYVVNLVYNALMKYDENGTYTTDLASEAPTISNDGKSITFKIRKGIKFSDGSKLDANDVKTTFTILCDKSYTGRFSSYVGLDTNNNEKLVGYKDYFDGKTKEVSGIKVVDDYTVEFDFTSARSDNLYNIGSVGILSDKQMKNYKNGKAKVAEKAEANPIGTGPYKLNSYDKGNSASLVKSSQYKGDGYKIKNVIIKTVDMSTSYEEIKSGNIDMLEQSIEPSKVGPASKNSKISMNTYPRAGLGYICFNTENGATSDKSVRQSLMYGFDRTGFVSSYFECTKCKTGVGQDLGYVPASYENAASAVGAIVRGEETLDGLNNYTYNIDTAKQELDAAGWTVGSDGYRYKDGQKLTIKMLAIEDHDICNTLIPMWKKDWGEKLGVDFKVTTVDFNTLANKVNSEDAAKEWNVFFMAVSFTGDQMGEIYSNFHSSQAKDGGDNYAKLKDPELDALLDQGASTLDQTAAKEIYKKIMIRINDDAAMMPVYGNTYYELYRNDRIKNMKTSTLYPWTSGLKDATIKK